MKSSRSNLRPEPLPAQLADAVARAADRLRPVGQRWLYFPLVGSTNDIAASIASASDSEGAVVVADEQTIGRGRRGHGWFSPPGSGLYVSVVLAPGRAHVAPGRAAMMLPLMAGLALSEAIEGSCGLRVDLKWPNDLFVGRRKVGGILAEGLGADSSLPGEEGTGVPRGLARVVLGYGINVSAVRYPPELADRATSIEAELGGVVDRAWLLVETVATLSGRYTDLLAGRYDAILDAWRSRAPTSSGTRVSWSTPDGARSGMTAGIDADGALLVLTDGQTDASLERIVAGELRWP